MNKLRQVLLVCVLLCWHPYIEATTQVSWLTCWPGDEVYELEGHSALRVRTDSTDYVVNWGLFDFNAPAFVWRFALGETDYMVGAHPTTPFVESYIPRHRRVTEQVLNLDSVATARLIAMIDSTIQPGVNTYRYNYVLDNCATRPLEYLEKATGKKFVINVDRASSPTTFRTEMRRYHEHYPWYQFGIDLALGNMIDDPISVREEGFAPIRMLDLLQSATYPGGEMLVTSTHDLFRGRESAGSTVTYVSPMSLAVIILLLTFITVIVDIKRHKINRWVTSVFFTVEFFGGCLITFLVFVSSHYATSPNWILLWLNPLALIPAIGVWLGGKCCRTLTLYFVLNIVAVASLGMIFASGIQCGNIAFWPLMCASILLSIDYLVTHHKQSR